MPKTVGKSPEASPASKAKPIHKRAKAASLSIAYPNACGIDIGARPNRKFPMKLKVPRQFRSFGSRRSYDLCSGLVLPDRLRTFHVCSRHQCFFRQLIAFRV